ncbi:hypothetical protein SELMODRAFT_407847 [Selaginella moellendorffii]|uniref:Uncharacterized protein n=1 Tax=Selaginella moellendorffii TaxID=88036 RepID=D8R4Y6_SELML|nr:hypothetical protein SELMODRAFT_407847 [Selaginella moellendorffii]
MVEHNGSDEFSDGSDPEHLVQGPRKGKMRLGGGGGNSRPASTAVPRAKRKKTVAAGGGGGTSSGMTRIQEVAVVETNLVGRKVIIKHEIQEDSEEMWDDLMDDAKGNDKVFEDDEETKDNVDQLLWSLYFCVFYLYKMHKQNLKNTLQNIHYLEIPIN